MAYFIKKRKPRLVSSGDGYESNSEAALSAVKAGRSTANGTTGALIPVSNAHGAQQMGSTSYSTGRNRGAVSTASATNPNGNGSGALAQPRSGGTGSGSTGFGGGNYDGSGTYGNSGSGGVGGSGYTGFEDAYNRIIAILNSYGIPMTFPTFDELYDQLEALLRPSVDAAIEQRQRYGEATLAELDADAYSRGMGGSSYLSSMKHREYDNIASDVARLEANYTSDIAEYLYNATNELSKLQAQFATIFLQHSFDQAAASGSGGSSNGGGGSSHGSGNSNSQSASNEQDEPIESSTSSYAEYCAYMEYLSKADRHKVFHSADAYWVNIRNEIIRSLSHDEYLRLRSLYDAPSSGGGGHGNHSGGETGWVHVLS
ncbi:MAG: hypothetical protein J1E60_02205 [Christensenellaceae bacterium]|nr:hypothetical protein [Christensenellaceae bacterium]